jgi:cytochrome c-type biogenesis protein CcmH
MLATFWIIASMMCVLAAAFILWPVWRRRHSETVDRTDLNVQLYRARLQELEESRTRGEMTEAEYTELEQELQLALLQDAGEEMATLSGQSRLPIIFAAAVVILSIFTYSDFGLSFGALNDWLVSEEIHETEPHDAAEMLATVEKLSASLQNQPDNDQGWFLLGQSWRSLSVYDKSADAFGHLLQKYPGDASLASYYAEALFLADKQRFTPRVKLAVEQALELNPNNILMLEFTAMEAYRAGDKDTALTLFRRALSGADGERATLLQQAISRISAESVGASAERAPPVERGIPAGRKLKVLVELAEGVSSPANATVYVYARAFQGPPMPLAVERLTVSVLPALVTLTAGQAMMQGMSLDDVDTVQLVARISESGIANASPDDYEVVSQSIDMTQEQSVIKLIITNRRG